MNTLVRHVRSRSHADHEEDAAEEQREAGEDGAYRNLRIAVVNAQSKTSNRRA
jgi:hypothetical protein